MLVSGFDLFSMSLFYWILLTASLDCLGSGPPERKCVIYYNLCVTKRTVIFKEHLSVATSVSECLGSTILDRTHLISLKFLLRLQ